MKQKLLILAIVLCSIRCIPVDAEPIGSRDPCSSLRSLGTDLSLPRSHIEIDKQAAIEIGKHIQKACLLIGKLRDNDAVKTDPRLSRGLEHLAKRLIAILDEIYREHPGLRDTDLTVVSADKSKTSPTHPLMGTVTASHLRWMLADVDGLYFGAFNGVPCKDEADCLAEIDLLSEIGFAASPIYKSYPGLRRLEIREAKDRAKVIEKRSAKSDEAFRKVAPRPGSVKLSPAASSEMRKWMAQIQKEPGAGCNLASMSWSLETKSKGPDDADWKTSGPGLTFGAYSCDRVPADVVRTIDGLRIIFAGDNADRFEGKLIDFENGRFTLKDN